MDLVTGLMLTCVALFQEAETPLGHVAAFDAPDKGRVQDSESSALAREVNARRTAMQTTIANAYRAFERGEAARVSPNRREVYMGLRRVASGGMQARR